VDDELLRLRRACADDPADPLSARAYDAALHRAGKPEEVYERFKLKFQCPKRWEELTQGQALGIRHCDECQKDVYWVSSAEEFDRRVQEGGGRTLKEIMADLERRA